MLVFRIENEEGEGPYLHKDLSHTPLEIHNYDDIDHPTLSQDDELRRLNLQISFDDKLKYRFGFTGAKQLIKWFDHPCRKWLAENGYKISVYKISGAHVRSSRFQAIFNKAEASLVMRKEFTA